MNRDSKVKLMFGQPCDVQATGFVEASFKNKEEDEWAESKRKKAMQTMSAEQFSKDKYHMDGLKGQLEAERAKRLEIEQELMQLQG